MSKKLWFSKYFMVVLLTVFCCSKLEDHVSNCPLVYSITSLSTQALSRTLIVPLSPAGVISSPFTSCSLSSSNYSHILYRLVIVRQIIITGFKDPSRGRHETTARGRSARETSRAPALSKRSTTFHSKRSKCSAAGAVSYHCLHVPPD